MRGVRCTCVWHLASIIYNPGTHVNCVHVHDLSSEFLEFRVPSVSVSVSVSISVSVQRPACIGIEHGFVGACACGRIPKVQIRKLQRPYFLCGCDLPAACQKRHPHNEPHARKKTEIYERQFYVTRLRSRKIACRMQMCIA